jgi:hypothetical protein
MESTDPTPNYREAYPRFDLIEAEAVCQRQPSGCVFRSGRMTVGHLVVPDTADNSFLIAYFIHGPLFGPGEGELWLKTKPIKSTVHRDRRAIICPKCSELKYTIFFKDSWLCAECHGLPYRSQVVDRTCIAWENYDRLRAMSKNGRPKGMHNATYIKLLQELHSLDERLAGTPRKYAAEDHRHVCSSTWIPLKDFGDLWVSRYRIVNGDVCVDRRGVRDPLAIHAWVDAAD